jgi:hypothetical protein
MSYSFVPAAPASSPIPADWDGPYAAHFHVKTGHGRLDRAPGFSLKMKASRL